MSLGSLGARARIAADAPLIALVFKQVLTQQQSTMASLLLPLLLLPSPLLLAQAKTLCIACDAIWALGTPLPSPIGAWRVCVCNARKVH